MFLFPKNEINESEESGAQAIDMKERKNIEHIVFLGIDKEENRSDTMMVIAINKDLNEVRVVSILRDSKVEIEGHAPSKIGFAYKWGGTQFALDTINNNFNTDFSKYIAMNFENVADIVDYLDGIEIDLTAEEAEILNQDILSEYDVTEGVNTLNGVQTVIYSRIRKIDGEYYRAGRQQTVINAMLKKVKSMSRLKLLGMVDLVTKSLETNVSIDELFKYATMDMSTLNVTSYTIPDAEYEENLFGGWEDNTGMDEMEDDVQWVWIYDLQAASQRLRQTINWE